jgi:hypothetical protein
VLTINFELTQYLQAHGTVSTRTVARFLHELARFQLTKAERLVLVNLRPRTLVEFHAVVEECEERFGEDEIETILAIFNSDGDSKP